MARPRTTEPEKYTGPMYPTATMEKLLNIKQRRLYVLAEKGIIPPPERGQWQLVGTIQGYVKYLQEMAYGRKANHQSEPEIDYKEEKAKLAQAQAEKARIEVDLLKGKMHKAEDVQRVVGDMVMRFRSRILALPKKSAGQVIGLATLVEAETVLKDAVHDALNELSEYDPSQYLTIRSEEPERRDELAEDEENDDDGDDTDGD